MATVLSRMPLDDLNSRSRTTGVGRTILTVIAAVFYGLGWTAHKVLGGGLYAVGWSAAKVFGALWVALVWMALAVKVGWVEARTGGARGSA